MEFRSFLVLIFSQVLLPKIGSTTLRPAADPSIPVTLEQKMVEMEERLEKKLTAKIEAEVKDLATRLDGQREEIIKKVSEAVHATTVVFGRLKNAERTFIQVDTHLLEEVQRAHNTLSEATENIRRLQQEVAKEDNLQISTTPKPSPESINPVTEVLEGLEERLSSLERADLMKKVENLSLKVERTEAESKDEISKRFSECVQSTEEISRKLQSAENAFLGVDTHLLMELYKVQEKSLETFQKVQDVESAFERERSQADIFKVKLRDTQDKLNSVIDSAKESEAVIRKNITEVAGNLKLFLNDSLHLGFQKTHSNFTEKMRVFENSLRRIEKDCANSSHVSKMDESTRNLEKDVETLRSEFSELKKRCEDVAELNKTLSNHSSAIAALNKQLFDIQNSCPDPPEISNGYPLLGHKRIQDTKNGAVVAYACRGNWTLAGSGGIVCRSGEWTDLPECMNSCNTEELKDSDGLDIPMHIIIQHSKSLDIRCLRGYAIASTSESLTCFNGTWHASGDLCVKESCDDEPPAVRNGKPVDFERKPGSSVRYQCDRSFVMSRNSTIRCRKGKWEGQPPVCSLFDATFYLQTWTVPSWIECYSVDNYQKIDFSRVLVTGSDAHLLGDVKKGSEPGYSYIYSDNPRSPWYYGSFQCGFSDERGSMNIVVQKQDVSGDLYFADPFRVANIGDAVQLEVKFNKVKSIRWRHNGVDAPSWDNEERVEIPSVQPTDAGTYECYYEGQREVTAPALLRLIVRSKFVCFSRNKTLPFYRWESFQNELKERKWSKRETHCIFNEN